MSCRGFWLTHRLKQMKVWHFRFYHVHLQAFQSQSQTPSADSDPSWALHRFSQENKLKQSSQICRRKQNAFRMDNNNQHVNKRQHDLLWRQVSLEPSELASSKKTRNEMKINEARQSIKSRVKLQTNYQICKCHNSSHQCTKYKFNQIHTIFYHVFIIFFCIFSAQCVRAASERRRLSSRRWRPRSARATGPSRTNLSRKRDQDMTSLRDPLILKVPLNMVLVDTRCL